MEKTKNKQQMIDVAVAGLFVILSVVVAIIKLTSNDIYADHDTVFQTARACVYVVGIVFAALGFGAVIVAYVKGKAIPYALTYGFLALTCVCLVAVQGCSLAGEFENQGKALQDAMYLVVFLLLAGAMYLLCAMENPKPIFRIIIITLGVVLFAAAMTTDFAYLMEKSGRINDETQGGVVFALYFDKVVVLLIGLAGLVHEVAAAAKAKKVKVEVESN